MLVDANHCPGAVQFLFELPNGEKYIHCGDMRFGPHLLQNPHLKYFQDANAVFLDTTYCNPKYTFPAQVIMLILCLGYGHLRAIHIFESGCSPVAVMSLKSQSSVCQLCIQLHSILEFPILANSVLASAQNQLGVDTPSTTGPWMANL